MQEPEVQNKVYLGDLLLRAEVINADSLQDALSLSQRMHVKLGRVLTMQGHLTEQHMAAAEQITALIEYGDLTLEQGVKAIQMVCNQNIDLKTAMNRLSQAVDTGTASNRLGELLQAASILTPAHLRRGLKNYLDTGVPLGRVLVNTGIISESILHAGISAQRLIFKRLINREQAVCALRTAYLDRSTLEEALKKHNLESVVAAPTFGLGELFVYAGIISDNALVTAREIEIVEEKELEQVFLECGYASKICLTGAGNILQMLQEGLVVQDVAAHLLRKVKDAKSFEEVQAALSNFEDFDQENIESVDFTEIIKGSALLSQEELEAASAESLQSRKPLLQTLVEKGKLTSAAAEAIKQLKTRLDIGSLQLEQAVIALAYSFENDLPLEETIDYFGWSNTASR